MEEPLLAAWRDVESQTPRDLDDAPLTAPELSRKYPHSFISEIRLHGVTKLGDARVWASGIPPSLTADKFLTRGSSTCTLLSWSAWGVQPVEMSIDGSGEHDHGDTIAGDGGGGAWWRQVKSLVRRGGLQQPEEDPFLVPTPGRSGSGRLWAAARTAQLRRQPTATPPAPAPTVLLEAYCVNVRDAAAAGEQGLLRPLLQRWHLGSCSASVFGLPAVQAVIAAKWNGFARKLLLQQLLFYAMWLFGFTAFLLLFNSSDAAVATADLFHTWQGCAAVAAEAVALLGMLPFAVSEVVVFAAYGPRFWISAWNALDLATYVLQVAITVLHVCIVRNGPLLLTLAVAAQAVLLVVRLTYFSRVFRNTTFDFVGSLMVVSREVGWYLALLLLLMWGFACSFYTVFQDDVSAEVKASFSSLPMSMLTMLNYAIGGTSYYMRDLMAGAHPMAAVFLCTLYQFLVSMLLMSLLTGVMTNALSRVSQQEAFNMLLNRAQVIDELEVVGMPSLLRVLTHEDLSLPYVHVLRINPHSLERVDCDDMWPGGAGGGPSSGSFGGGGNGGGGGSGSGGGAMSSSAAGAAGGKAGEAALAARVDARMQRVEGRMQRLEAQLGQVHELLQQLVAASGAGSPAAGQAEAGS